MRLTNTMRDAFVRAAMQDVPALEDYTEQAHKLAMEDAIARMPPKVQAIAKDKTASEWLGRCYYGFGGYPWRSMSIFTINGNGYGPSPECRAKLDEMSKKHSAAKSVRDNLELKLRAVAYSCNTRKALADALPEFERYLPEDEAKAIRTLPVIANVVADFTKAGWPKTKTQKAN